MTINIPVLILVDHVVHHDAVTTEFVTVVCQISCEFFIFQQDSTRANKALETVSFITHITSPDVNPFQKFFHSGISSKFVVK